MTLNRDHDTSQKCPSLGTWVGSMSNNGLPLTPHHTSRRQQQRDTLLPFSPSRRQGPFFPPLNSKLPRPSQNQQQGVLASAGTGNRNPLPVSHKTLLCPKYLALSQGSRAHASHVDKLNWRREASRWPEEGRIHKRKPNIPGKKTKAEVSTRKLFLSLYFWPN